MDASFPKTYGQLALVLTVFQLHFETFWGGGHLFWWTLMQCQSHPAVSMGSLSNNDGDGDGYENVTLKKWIRAASNFIALIPCRLMLAHFTELNSKGLYQSSRREKGSCCLVFPDLDKT